MKVLLTALFVSFIFGAVFGATAMKMNGQLVKMRSELGTVKDFNSDDPDGSHVNAGIYNVMSALFNSITLSLLLTYIFFARKRDQKLKFIVFFFFCIIWECVILYNIIHYIDIIN